jgi:hypothetical protein
VFDKNFIVNRNKWRFKITSLVRTIEKVKRDYSNITKLLFYTNQEWAQHKGKKPKGLTEVEKKAKELKVTLECLQTYYFIIFFYWISFNCRLVFKAKNTKWLVKLFTKKKD